MQTLLTIYSIKASWQLPRESVSYKPLLMSIIIYNHLPRAVLAPLQSDAVYSSFPVIRDHDDSQGQNPRYLEANTYQNKGLVIIGSTDQLRIALFLHTHKLNFALMASHSIQELRDRVEAQAN